MKTKLILSFSFVIFFFVNSQNFDHRIGLNQSSPFKLQQIHQSLLTDTISIPLGGKYIEALSSCDIDKDGKDELIVLTNYDYYAGSPQKGQLRVYKWKDNSFELSWQSSEIAGYPYGIQIADINSDGYKDILVSCSGIQLFLNNSGTLSYYGLLSSQESNGLFIASDLNNDNKLDLAFGAPYSNSSFSIKLYKQNTNLNFTHLGDINCTNGNNMLKELDVNNDNSTDMLNVEVYSGDVYVLQYNKTLGFQSTFKYKFSTRVFNIETADFDNDGFDDFIVAEAWKNIHFFQNKQSTFKIMYKGSNIGSTFLSQAIDINKDGLIDLVTAPIYGDIYFYKNKGNFQFEEISAQTNYVPENFGLAIGDFDKDGNLDVAFGKDPVYIAFNVNLLFKISDVNENVVNENIKIYPNPIKNFLEIESPQNSLIEICNSQGQIIKKISTTNLKTSVDLSAFTNGLYILTARTDKGIVIKKIIKE